MAAPLHTLVFGIGNEYRRDDAVGLVVARRIKARAPAHVSIFEHCRDGASLMEAWNNSPALLLKAQRESGVIIIDAVHSGAEPGTVFRFEAHAQPVPAKFFHCSSHAFGLAEAIEMARVLHQLPPCLIVYGIEGKNFAAGKGLSAEVEKSVPGVVENVWREAVCTTQENLVKGGPFFLP
jgi:hydrogenase maturation protease